jgi:hypothetical protein
LYIKEAEANPGLYLMHDACCEELEDAFEGGYLDYNPMTNRFGADMFNHLFNFCPFCGKEIKLETFLT